MPNGQTQRATVMNDQQDGVGVVRVSGIIDESFPQAQLVDALSTDDPVIIDLDGTTRITSYGVRQWLVALSQRTTPALFFTNVRSTIVAQFNSIADFSGQGYAITFYCPYVCPDCGNEFEQRVDVRKDTDTLHAKKAPPARCPKCQAEADFDDLEAVYFSRIIERPLPALPEPVIAYLDGRTPRRPLHIEKDVTEEVTAVWISGGLDGGARLKRTFDGLEGEVAVVLTGVTSVDEAGIAKLEEALAAAGGRAALARVTLPMLRHFAAHPTGTLAKACVSAVVPTACAACRTLNEVDTRIIRARTVARCTSCVSVLNPVVAAEDLGVLSTFPFATASGPIAAYLEARDRPDTTQRVDLQKTPTGHVRATGQGSKVGRYEVVRRIGMGGMAEVLLGRQIGLGGFEKKVVIKKILPHLVVQPAFVQQFLEEARVAARLSHPHIVQIFDVGREGDDYYIVMELIAGADWNTLIRTAIQLGEPIPLAISARLMTGVCAGLHAAHTFQDDQGVARPVIHRDISPHNVLLGLDGAVKITDFGVAKASDSVSQTNTGTLKGKVAFMAPELILGKPADPRVDIFAAGLCLYFAVTQHQPYYRDSEIKSLKAVLEQEVPAPSTLRHDLPADLERIILRAVARNPDERYQSAAAFQADLDTWLSRAAPGVSFATVATWMRDLQERGLRRSPTLLQQGIANGDQETTITTPDRVMAPRAVGAGDADPADEL